MLHTIFYTYVFFSFDENKGNNFGGSTSSGIGVHGHHNSSASDYGSGGGSSGHVTPQHLVSNQQSHTNLNAGQNYAGPDGNTTGNISYSEVTN